MLSLILAISVASLPTDNPICEVGKVALGDFMKSASDGSDRFYGRVSPSEPDLLEVCPELKAGLPAGYAKADDSARTRAGLSDSPNRIGTPASIHSVSVPVIAADGKTATVSYYVFCGGLCGGGQYAKYVLRDNRWQRDGGVGTLYVS